MLRSYLSLLLSRHSCPLCADSVFPLPFPSIIPCSSYASRPETAATSIPLTCPASRGTVTCAVQSSVEAPLISQISAPNTSSAPMAPVSPPSVPIPLSPTPSTPLPPSAPLGHCSRSPSPDEHPDAIMLSFSDRDYSWDGICRESCCSCVGKPHAAWKRSFNFVGMPLCPSCMYQLCLDHEWEESDHEALISHLKYSFTRGAWDPPACKPAMSCNIRRQLSPLITNP